MGVTLALAAGACGTSAGGDLGSPDPRCQALCTSADATCADAVTSCQQQCQLRVADVAPLCATCLLEGSEPGSCPSGGGPCCPAPYFPHGVLDCTSACAGSTGVNPADHPICAQICASDDAACGADVTSCLDQCRARVAGVSGLCALCLLDGASGGSCSSGQTCCPRPDFPTTVAACADACSS